MTSIIQSNRERKSRIDRGLVERLNNPNHGKVDEISKETLQRTAGKNVPTSELRFITDRKEFDDIITYMNKNFRKYNAVLSDLLNYEDGVMKGSNVYIASTVNRYLMEINSDYRIASLKDLEANLDFVHLYRVDTGIVVRQLSGYMTREKIQDTAIDVLIKTSSLDEDQLPAYIDMKNIVINRDMTISTTKINAFAKPESLKWPGPVFFSKTDRYGFPIEEDERAERILYNEQHAISRCLLDLTSNIMAYILDFSSSQNFYRIVLVRK